jgi:hypothetical protein
MSALGTFYARRTNDYVPNMQYAADIGTSGIGKVTLQPLPAANATALLNATNIAATGSAAALAAGQTQLGMFGRNVTLVASGAASSVVTINGRDYLGQPMTEALTLNGTTPVVGKKAFGTVDRASFLATAVTINLGTGNVLGLPYKIIDMYTEAVSGVEAASAGTVQVGVSPQTSTSGDPRGTYTPAAGNVPDGIKVYTITGIWDNTNLYGTAHFFA